MNDELVRELDKIIMLQSNLDVERIENLSQSLATYIEENYIRKDRIIATEYINPYSIYDGGLNYNQKQGDKP